MSDTLLTQVYQRTKEQVHKEIIECKELSARELFIVQLFVKGNSLKNIAGYLCLSLGTVQSHFKHIYEKLGIQKQTELVSWYHNQFFKSSGK